MPNIWINRPLLRALILGVAVPLAYPSSSYAQQSTPKNEIESLRQQGYSVRSITPIFAQLVTFSLPPGFRPVFENASANQYIQESVLEGETVKKWTQMITVTGAKGIAPNPNITPQLFAGRMAAGFKRDCPDSYSAIGLGASKLSGHEAFAAIMSCGVALLTGEPYSESMLLVVIRGESDYYTIQWAERGDASRSPIQLNDPKWTERLKRLSPIKLCPKVPGEAAPYPSCVDQK